MSEEVGSLVARVVADTEQFRSEMTRLARTVESNTARMNTSLSKLSTSGASISKAFTAARSVLAAFGVALSVGAITRFVSSTIKAGEELYNLSNRLNVSVEALSELQYVAKLNDVQFDSFTRSMQFMVRTIGEANQGSKQATTTLSQLGLSLSRLTSLSVDQQFNEVAAALAAVADETQRAALAQDLFGRSGIELLQVINQGTDAINAQRQEARELGVVMSTELAESAAQASDEIDRLSKSAEALGNTVANRLLPYLADAVEGWRIFLNPTQIEEAQAELRKVYERIEEIKEEIVSVDNRGIIGKLLFGTAGSGALKAELQGLKDRAAELLGTVVNLSRGMSDGAGATKSPAGANSMFAQGYASLEQQRRQEMGQLQEIDVLAEKQEVMRSMESELQAQLKAIRDKSTAEEIERTQTELDAWERFSSMRFRQEQDVADQQQWQRQATLDNVGYTLDTIMSLSQGHSKKMFEFAKKAAIANAIVSTAAGAAKALEQGGFFGIAMAAAVIAAGASQIATIRAQQFDSGAGNVRSIGGSATVVTSSPASQDAAGSTSRSRVTQIVFRGDFYGFDELLKRKLIDAIRDAVDNRDVVIIGQGSRQAALLSGE